MDVYAENILDHYRHPRGKVAPESPTVSHEEINVSCGDALTIQLIINDEKVTEVGWEGTGCAISQAAMSMMSEELAGKSVADLEKLTKENIYEMLGVPIGPRRVKCALLGLHALKNALRKSKDEEVQGWTETIAE